MNSYDPQESKGFIQDLKEAFEHEYGIGPEQARAVMYEARKRKGKQPDAPKMRQMLGAYRSPQAFKAALGFKQDSDYEVARALEGASFMTASPGNKLGTALGALGSDLTQDSLRRFWWLLNAAQATGEVIAEEGLVRARPELYETYKTGYTAYDKKGNAYPETRRKFKPGYVQSLAIPAGIAINTGLGLMTPFGGAEGYKAALPSDEDPTKTSNVLGEVAAKYFLGRTGNLLPYQDFKEVRPDVSADEYGRYKAFKFDKKTDLNPFDDGKMTIPTGVAKYTNEGIHGPEVQFLGRSLPVTTGLVPFAGAVAWRNGALGVSKLGPVTGDATQTPNSVKRQFGSDKPIRRGFMGGLAGLAVGQDYR
jgi:hypothetical protein